MKSFNKSIVVMGLASVAAVGAAAAALSAVAPVAILGGIITIGGSSTGVAATIAGLSAVGAGSLTSELAAKVIPNDDLKTMAKTAANKEPIEAEIVEEVASVDDLQETTETKV